MPLSINVLGQLNGKDILEYSFSYNDIYLSLLNFNGIINKLRFNNEDVVFSYDSYKDYLDDNRYIECFEDDNYKYYGCDLYKNVFWQLKSYHEEIDRKVILFEYRKKNENIIYKLQYTLKKNSLIISYKGGSKGSIPITALKNTFFNISAEKNILDHKLILKSKEIIISKDSDKPDEIVNVSNSFYDFNKEIKVKENFENAENKSPHPYIIDKYEQWPIKLSFKDIIVKIRSKEPVIVLNPDYKNGYSGLCFDSHCDLNLIDENLLKKNRKRIKDTYETKTEYKFIKKD